MSHALQLVDSWLGLHVAPENLTLLQMVARTVVVFIFGVILVRVADRRFLGRSAGFDMLLGVVLGSVLSRAINGSAAFFPTLAACAVLVGLHHVLGTLTCRFHFFSDLVKGNAQVLVRNGRTDPAAMRANKISSDDLEENLRLNGNVAHAGEVGEARLERNGQVSVVRRGEPTQENEPARETKSHRAR